MHLTYNAIKAGDNETRICSSELLNETDCSNCTWIIVELTLDNYPEETTELCSSDDKSEFSVLAGE